MHGCLSDAEADVAVVAAGLDMNFSTRILAFVEKDISTAADSLRLREGQKTVRRGQFILLS